jgi:hypothetical protein
MGHKEIQCLANLVLCLPDNIPTPQPQPPVLHQQCHLAQQAMHRHLIVDQRANMEVVILGPLPLGLHQEHPKVYVHTPFISV